MGRLQKFKGDKDIMINFFDLIGSDLRAVLSIIFCSLRKKEGVNAGQAMLKKEYEMLRNKSRFIKAIIEGGKSRKRL